MSEMALDPEFENMLRNATPAQKQQYLNLLNPDQKALALPYQFPGVPENFGQALGNIGRNIGYRAAVKYGLLPDPQGMLANQQYIQSQLDMNLQKADVARNLLFRNYLTDTLGMDKQMITGASDELLDEIGKSVQGEPFYGPDGTMYTRNKVTNEITKVSDLPEGLREWYLSSALKTSGTDPQLNDAQAAIISGEPDAKTRPLPPGFSDTQSAPELSPGEYKRREATSTRLSEKSQDRLFKLGDEYQTNAYGAVEQIKRLDDMQLLLQTGIETGGGQEFILDAQRLGFNLGITNVDPTPSELFNSLATGFILPLARTLGVNPTDRDMELIGKAAAGLNKTPEGNMIIIAAKKIESERAKLINDAWLDFTQANIDNYKYDPAQFDIDWKRKLQQVMNAPGFKGADVIELKARARSLLRKPINIDDGMEGLIDG